MKYCIISLVTALTLQAHASKKYPGLISEAKVKEITCGNKITIKDHMARMGFIIRTLREAVQDVVQGNTSDDLKAIVMIDTQILRVHLATVFTKTPDKIQQIDPKNLQKAKLIFQTYLLHLMKKTVELEEQLLLTPTNQLEQQSQRVKIASIIINMDETIQEAHNKFRY